MKSYAGFNSIKIDKILSSVVEAGRRALTVSLPPPNSHGDPSEDLQAWLYLPDNSWIPNTHYTGHFLTHHLPPAFSLQGLESGRHLQAAAPDICFKF